MLLPNRFQVAEDGTLMFPVLPGMSLEYTPRPTFSTIVQTATDRSTTRIGLDPYPLWQYDLSFGYVSDDGQFSVVDATTNPAALTQYEQILGLFLACGGQRDTFLFRLANMTKKASDSTATNVPIGVGDGGTNTFQLVRPVGGFLDLVDNPILSTLVVTSTLSGTPTVVTPTSVVNGLVTLPGAPATGAVVTASFDYLLRMRFVNDAEEFAAVSYLLYDRAALKLTQERNQTA